ncbi:hypothetical protein HYH03_011621 [Edaphochlamys debaryana]|uniref:BTB domain-containing protein n=1 Tax=Edaphochlamys debaryana TaxID=47281 RepID=A0A835XRS9_9CHLO|nr:hypothetical protein HYH03_011621 [Edaphochlamys debaryana]|eukprot:KAG2489992.1 hypothetical protein HYH03_011621 [Edaphochlamys debaryana]
MLQALRSFVAALFGSEDSSDCIVEFNLSKDEADRPAKRQRTASEQKSGDSEEDKKLRAEAQNAALTATSEASQPPKQEVIDDVLVAHTWILRPGSTFFRSQAERWTAEQPAGSKRVLRVPLGSPDDLPHARSAIRFIYTGELDVSSAANLLRVRRMASYLGVEGYTEACDTALLALARKAPAPPLTTVAELYACRTLLPDPRGEDPTAAGLLDSLRTAGQEQLVAYKGTAAEVTATGGSKVQLGELLAWAFQDAPGVLNNPAVKGRARSLPPCCLEALLSCDAFATDDEASVLLLLAEWLDANPSTAEDVRKRLCGCIRLCHLNSGYLTGVLPLLSWFPLTPDEHILLCQMMAVLSGASRDQFVKMATQSDYQWPSCWTSGAARPHGSGSVGRVFEWSVAQEDVGGATGLVYRGFEIYPSVQLPLGGGAAGAYLCCRLPTCLKPSRVPAVVVSPGNARLTAWKWAEGSDGRRERQTAHSFTYKDWSDCMRWAGWGTPKALPLLAAPAAAAAPSAVAPDPLARWAPYLHEGRLSGTLEWLPA